MQENQANDKVRDMHSGGIQEGASNTQLKTETPNKPIQTWAYLETLDTG